MLISFAAKLLRDSNKNLEHLFGGKSYQAYFLCLLPVGVKFFWVDLNGKHGFCAYPQCSSSASMGGVYVILI